MISWIDLRERSPIDISNIVSNAGSFNSLVGVRITVQNLDKAKKSLMEARTKLDLMVVCLRQLLSDRTILKTRTDEILFEWLGDNMGRCLKNLDEKEEEFLIKYDEVNNPIKRVGVSRVSAYAKELKIISESLIYASLLKSIKEYEELKDGEKIKGEIIIKEPRTFLYILFQVLQVTLNLLGGLAREGKTMGLKKGQVSSMPTTWASMMAPNGQKAIADKHKQETGEEIKVDEYLIEKNDNINDNLFEDEDE